MYRIVIDRSAAKVLAKLTGKMYQSVSNVIADLQHNPYPAGAIPLQGSENIYRIRKGSIRIIYEVSETELIIYVLAIGQRGQVYQDF